MKKLLLVIVLLISFTSIYAKSAQVELQTNVEEREVSYNLYYINEKIEDNINDYVIEVNPLNEDGQTDYFSIIASGNKNNDLSVSVEVVPQSFKTILNGNKTFDSNITPLVNTEYKLDIFPAGNNDNLLVNKFYLNWSGNENLPAGEYKSNIFITYTIE